MRALVGALGVVCLGVASPCFAQLSFLVSPDGTSLAYAVPAIGEDRWRRSAPFLQVKRIVENAEARIWIATEGGLARLTPVQ